MRAGSAHWCLTTVQFLSTRLPDTVPKPLQRRYCCTVIPSPGETLPHTLSAAGPLLTTWQLPAFMKLNCPSRSPLLENATTPHHRGLDS